MIAPVERPTVDIYQREAATYASLRPPKHRGRAAAFADGLARDRPVLDVGCGPGGYLPDLLASGAPVVALDAARAMLDLARVAAPAALSVQGDVAALPFRRGSLGGAWARNTYLHIARADLPLALAHLHAALAVGAPVIFSVVEGDGEGLIAEDDIGGRFFANWRRGPLADVSTGAGFDVQDIELVGDELWVHATRARTLPDFAGPGMDVLVCGLNPSLAAVDAGYGFAGATNRFWPAAIDTGLVTRARDPFHALTVDRVGMTDLVKRATARADDLTAAEYRGGTERVRRLVAWLHPQVVLFVGLTGWRAGVDPAAAPGWQPEGFAGAKAYVMPSTSGANAHATRASIVEHLHAVRPRSGSR
jgi:TDG/mug DNA glycosylase family protein